MHPSPRTSHALRATMVLALAAQACADSDDDASSDGVETAAETDADDSSSSPDSTTSDGGADLDAAYDCVDPDLTVVVPLAGPGYDPAAGLLEPVQETYVVHSTQLLVNPDEASQAEFFALSDAVTAQLMESPGLVAVSIAFEPNCGFSRTLGIWRSEEDMYNFAGSGAHAEAMGRTTAISATGKVTHWEVNADAVPVEWPVAMARIGEVEPSGLYGN